MRTLPAGLAVFFLAHGALASAAVTPGYKLSLTVAGNGSVADSKGRITCTTNCARSFKEGVKVALNATPAAGLKFTSWGGACLGTGTCRLTMDGNLSVSARFAAAGGTTPPPPPPPQPPPPPPPPPPGSGTPYPGHTYQLPTTRPFISLAQYAGGSSAAVTRLRGQVDSAVAVTKSIGASGSYSALVNALNSNNYGYSSVDSVIMYKLTGNVAYIDQAIRMVDLFVTSENALINAGSVPKVAGDSYLEVGDYISQLALAYDYGFARLTTAQRSAWSSFAEQTIYNVWNYENATWGAARRPWTGWSVNDPGNNYYYSFLQGDAVVGARKPEQGMDQLPADAEVPAARAVLQPAQGRRLARRHGLRHRFRQPVRELRLLEGFHRRGSLRVLHSRARHHRLLDSRHGADVRILRADRRSVAVVDADHVRLPAQDRDRGDVR